MPQSLLSDKKNLTLYQVMNLLAQKHDNQTVINLTRKWCMASTSEDIQRVSMEFLYMNGFYTDLQIMINKNRDNSNLIIKEWAKYYQLMLDRRLKVFSAAETLQKVKNMRTDIAELKCLNEFIKISAYFSLNDFAQIGNFLHDQQALFALIDDRLLVTYFTIRTYQSLFIYHWTKNEMIIARKYGYQILNQIIDMKVKTSLHINLGLSYTFETYPQAMYHLKEALKIAKEQNFRYYTYIIKNNNIPFISAHFKQTKGITSQDKSEQAHLEIARGNHAKANLLLKKLSRSDPFNLYYLGLANKNENFLFQSYHKFIQERADYFYARLPLNALRNLN